MLIFKSVPRLFSKVFNAQKKRTGNRPLCWEAFLHVGLNVSFFAKSVYNSRHSSMKPDQPEVRKAVRARRPHSAGGMTMKKNILNVSVTTALLSLGVLSLGTLSSAAPITERVSISDGDKTTDLRYDRLYTESTWQTIRIPLRDIGGVLPNNLTLDTSGLPAGVTITLDGSSEDNGFLVLSVSTERSDTTVAVNTLANITLNADGSPITSFQVPVLGIASDSNLSY
jgi:hypothetical protein